MSLLSVEGVSKHYASGGGLFAARRTMRAVDGVSFALEKGRVLGVVGESGCGKSTLARLVLRLIAPTDGRVRFEGIDVAAQRGAAMRQLRARMQMVFQDPYSAIDPRFTIAEALAEPFEIHAPAMRGAERHARALALLETVGLSPDFASRHPHQLSGGQKQRVGIARALALEPAFVVLDEPTASLDVSVQASIVRLLERLRADLGLTYLFISHDLSLVRYFCDAVMVMYLGRAVEMMPTPRATPRHPYTRALLDSTFDPDPRRRRQIAPLPVEPPSPFDLGPGCAFRGRCAHASPRCATQTPALASEGGHAVACHHPL